MIEKDLIKKELVSREDLENELKGFKKFAFQKSMIDVAVGVILAGAFQKIITAISNGVIMPLANAALSSTGDGWRNAVWKITPNVVIETGAFVGSFVDFLLTALLLYILYVKIATPLLYPEDGNDSPPLKIPIYPPVSTHAPLRGDCD